VDIYVTSSLLTQSPVEVVIVCHSMGSRLVASALYKLGDKGAALPALHHVVFAASDLYTNDLSEHWSTIRLKDVGFSFYCSNHDLALRLSISFIVIRGWATCHLLFTRPREPIRSMLHRSIPCGAGLGILT